MKRLTITGNVGGDVQLIAAANGNQFAKFSVAVAVGTKQAPKTDWVEVTCNGKLMEVARDYVKKGGKVLVDGFPSVTAYINKDNLPVAQQKLYANHLELLTRATEDDEEQDLPTATETESPF